MKKMTKEPMKKVEHKAMKASSMPSRPKHNESIDSALSMARSHEANIVDRTRQTWKY